MGSEELKKRYDALVHEWEGAYRNPLERMSFSDFIARKVTQLEADRDNWRKQALNENARADALETRVTELEARNAN